MFTGCVLTFDLRRYGLNFLFDRVGNYGFTFCFTGLCLLLVC